MVLVWWILPCIKPTMRKSSDHDVLADITNLCIAEYKVVLPPSTCLQFNFNNSLVWDLVLGLNCQNLFRGAKLSFRNKDLSGTNKTFTGIRFAQDRNHNVLDMRFLITSLCWWWWRWCCWLWHYCLRKGAAYIRWPLTYSPSTSPFWYSPYCQLYNPQLHHHCCSLHH